MFSVYYRLLQWFWVGFSLKRSSRWWSKCVGSLVITSIDFPMSAIKCCRPSVLWEEMRSNKLLLHCNLRNSRVTSMSSPSLQPWKGISVRIGALVLLLKHCCRSSGFPEVVFNVFFDHGERSYKSWLVVFPLTHPLQWSWADGSSGNY